MPHWGRILEGFKTFKEPSHNDKLSIGNIPQNKKTRFFSGLFFIFYLSHSKGHWLFNRLLIFKFHRYLDSIGSFFIKSLGHLNTFSTITWKRLALISKWPINFFWQSVKVQTEDNRLSKLRFLCRMRSRANIKLNQLFIYNNWILKSEC